MPDESFFSDVRLGARPGRNSISSEPDRPFRIGVLGNFSGREWMDAEATRNLAQRSPIQVDRDNFDEVMEKLGVQCDASVGDAQNHVITLQFRGLEDFHPDRMFESVPAFANFRQLREDLLHPATYEAAAAEVRAWGLLKSPSAESPPQQREEQVPEGPASSGDGGSFLDEMIHQTEQNPASQGELDWSGEVREYVRRVVEPFSVPNRDADQAELVACVDAVAGQLMRSIMHDPRFQALEAAWRGLAFLVRRLATGADLNISLIDVSLPELATDIGSAGNVEASEIYKLLMERTVDVPGGQPWSALVGNYTLDAESLELLLGGCLARIAARAGAPLIVGAGPSLFGCRSLAETPHPDDWDVPWPAQASETWSTVRALPEAAYLGLVCPRFLLRLPYGRDSWPIDSFDFEELPNPEEHECYLWGNPALACAYLLAQAFEQAGWRMKPEMAQEIDGLPLSVYHIRGETEIKPPAEVLLTEGAILRILDAGVMPLRASRNSDVIRLGRWQSAASPPSPLCGPWS